MSGASGTIGRLRVVSPRLGDHRQWRRDELRDGDNLRECPPHVADFGYSATPARPYANSEKILGNTGFSQVWLVDIGPVLCDDFGPVSQ